MEAVHASKTPTRLRMVIGMKKGKAVDSYFQAIRNKVGKDKVVMMVYSKGSFPQSSKGEDSAPMGSMKRPFSARSAKEHRTSMGCPLCQKSDLVPAAADGRVQESKRSLDWRRCTACNLPGEAGRGEGTSRRGMQEDKRAALNARRGGGAEMKGTKRSYALQNAKSSL